MWFDCTTHRDPLSQNVILSKEWPKLLVPQCKTLSFALFITFPFFQSHAYLLHVFFQGLGTPSVHTIGSRMDPSGLTRGPPSY